MGKTRRAKAYEEDRRTKDRFASTLVIAAPIIAAVRLARMILEKVMRRLGTLRSNHDHLLESLP